jgi:hypothetical protein
MPDNKTAVKKILAILPPVAIPLQIDKSDLLKLKPQYWHRVQSGAHSPGSPLFFFLID